MYKNSEKKVKKPKCCSDRSSQFSLRGNLPNKLSSHNGLQQSLGNQAVGRLLQTTEIQTKLKIGKPNDLFEKEADRIADSFIYNNLNTSETKDEQTVNRNAESKVQRMCAECEEEELLLQRKTNDDSHSTVNLSTAQNIQTLQTGGQAIANDIRRPYEAHFGRDFRQVRIHTGKMAEQASNSINAKAYTLGHHIVFADNQYQPQQEQGQHLIAHELAHVVQQSNLGMVNHLQRATTGTGSGSASGSGTAPTTAPANGGLSDEMLRQIARRLRAAMRGPGTDEDAIYSSFSGRTPEQSAAIQRVYDQMYSRSLVADLNDELTRSELLRLGVFSSGAPGTTRTASVSADLVASQLNNAMDRIGTDEESIYAALTGRTLTERTAIKQAYLRLTHRTLEHDLRDEMSGTELTRALRLLNQGLLQPEDELYFSMAGLGTDEDRLFRVLDSIAGNSTRILQVAAAYRSKYGDLIAHLRDDLNSEEYARALRVLGSDLQDVDFVDCGSNVFPQIRALIPVGKAKVTHAIQVLSGGWSTMSTTQQSVFNRFFDPSGSGFDGNFVDDVLHNFRLIRREFDDDLTVECSSAGGLCTGQRLYYTYWGNIYVCPYFNISTNATRKQRDFVHELAHNAMYALDRPYYSPSSTEYSELTPRGIWSNQIPVIGAISRVISRSDTLYHPDAYSWFAFTV